MKYVFQRLQEVLDRDGEVKALAHAAKITCLGTYRDAIQKGWAATQQPSFYRQLGQDPAALQREGIAAMRQLLLEAAQDPAGD